MIALNNNEVLSDCSPPRLLKTSLLGSPKSSSMVICKLNKEAIAADSDAGVADGAACAAGGTDEKELKETEESEEEEDVIEAVIEEEKDEEKPRMVVRLRLLGRWLCFVMMTRK